MIAYQVNIRKQKNLRRDPISVKEESNSSLPQIPVLIF
jgi:hypothetical protein